MEERKNEPLASQLSKEELKKKKGGLAQAYDHGTASEVSWWGYYIKGYY